MPVSVAAVSCIAEALCAPSALPTVLPERMFRGLPDAAAVPATMCIRAISMREILFDSSLGSPSSGRCFLRENWKALMEKMSMQTSGPLQSWGRTGG